MSGSQAPVRLTGRIASPRKLETRGKYEARAFDLEIGDLQVWPCAAFGRAAGQLRRLAPGSWVQVSGEIAELSLERGRRTGIKIMETLVMPEPQPRSMLADLVAIQPPADGRGGWLELVDLEGVSWALEAAPERLADTVRDLETGARVLAHLSDIPVLLRFQGELRPVLASVLDHIEATPSAPTAA